MPRYFPLRPGCPPPLRLAVERRVRFEEVDPLGIVWHGRYPSYFEDARVALGDRFGVGYHDFYAQGVVTPIKRLQVDYARPLRFGEVATVEGILHWSEAARIDFEYVIRDGTGQVATTGCSVQLLLGEDQQVLLVFPPFYEAFRARWRAGELG